MDHRPRPRLLYSGGSMWLPVFAALACTLTSPATPATPGLAATAAPSTAMSLPLDDGPASPASLPALSSIADAELASADAWMSLPPAAEWALAALDPLTPSVVECQDDGARPPAPDCSALASRWTVDMLGSCELPRPS